VLNNFKHYQKTKSEIDISPFLKTQKPSSTLFYFSVVRWVVCRIIRSVHYKYYIHYRFNHGTYLHAYSSRKVEHWFMKKRGTTKLRNENETKWNETKRNTTKRNEKWRNETKRNEISQNETKYVKQSIKDPKTINEGVKNQRNIEWLVRLLIDLHLDAFLLQNSKRSTKVMHQYSNRSKYILNSLKC
jgi:hypothetical protein